MPTDLLDRLRAADIASDPDGRPAFADTLTRIEALADTRSGSRPPVRAPRLRRVVPAGVLATGALAATLVVVIGSPDDGAIPRLGVLQAAADTAGTDPDAGRFTGYVREERLTLAATSGTAAATIENRTIVRRVSATEFDGSLETTQKALPPVRPVPQRTGTPPMTTGGARVTDTRVGDRITSRTTWRRPYGTIFTGALGRGEQPVAVPTDPQEARRAIASWATTRAPAGGDPSQASQLREAYGAKDGTQLALGYATDVLTAPKVAPDVRAAIFDALADVPGVRIDPHATDPDGRPAAALTSEAVHGATRSRFELLIDPGTARVLGTRDRYDVPAGAQDDRPAGEPPLGSGGSASVFHYDD